MMKVNAFLNMLVHIAVFKLVNLICRTRHEHFQYFYSSCI